MGRSAQPDDEEAVELYVRARRVAARILGGQEAPDVASEVMVRLLTRWARVRDYSEQWVTVVAVNLAIDRLRRRRPTTEVAAQRIAAPDEDIDLRLTVVDLLGRLPRRQQQVVVLHHLVGLTDDEVARALDLSTPTVKTHLARAMTTLRDLAGRKEGDGVTERTA